MSDTYDSIPCDKRSADHEHPTQTLWSRITGTEDECVITPDEQATHEIKFRDVRRHSTEVTIVATCTEGSIQYTESSRDAELSQDNTRLEMSLRLENYAKTFSRQHLIEVCDNHSDKEFLKTSLRPRSTDETEESTADTVSNGSGQGAVADIELVPKLTIARD
jgi:hypothetical protein